MNFHESQVVPRVKGHRLRGMDILGVDALDGNLSPVNEGWGPRAKYAYKRFSLFLRDDQLHNAGPGWIRIDPRSQQGFKTEGPGVLHRPNRLIFASGALQRLHFMSLRSVQRPAPLLRSKKTSGSRSRIRRRCVETSAAGRPEL